MRKDSLTEKAESIDELQNSTVEEDPVDKVFYVTRENFIRPLNERTIKMQKDKEKEQEEFLIETKKKRKQEEDKLREDLEQKQKEQTEMLRKQAREDLLNRRLKEEIQELEKMNGEFGLLYQSFLQSKGQKEVFLSSMDLIPAQFRLLFRSLKFNSNINTLSINRKEMDDDEMDCLAESLRDNSGLQVLQVEDNNLSEISLGFLSYVLESNNVLNTLSLEGNDFSESKVLSEEQQLSLSFRGQDSIKLFAEALANNESLVYLNMADCNLNQEAGKHLLKAMETNKNLIMLDLERNFNLDFEDVRKIQQKLQQNFQYHKNRRLKEFQERKKMKQNIDDKTQKEEILKQEKKKVETIKASVKEIQKLKEQIFFEEQEKLKSEKEILKNKLDKDAKLRKNKRKKKKNTN
jgi:hypothetical protein